MQPDGHETTVTSAAGIENEAEVTSTPAAQRQMAGTGTDKDYWHRYTDVYDKAFEALGQVEDILEFGVLNGDSIRWLATRFPHARIVGADILSLRPSWPTSDRIDYVQVDQGDRSAVRQTFATLDRQYDLLIEDGSHIPQHQATCLLEGLGHVRPGKLYVLEDIHSSHPDNPGFRAHNAPGTVNALNVLLAIEHLKSSGQDLTFDLASGLASPGFFTADDIMFLFAKIATVHLYRRSLLPLRCYRCGTSRFDYRSLHCSCGTDLYAATDSMACLIQRSGD